MQQDADNKPNKLTAEQKDCIERLGCTDDKTEMSDKTLCIFPADQAEQSTEDQKLYPIYIGRIKVAYGLLGNKQQLTGFWCVINKATGKWQESKTWLIEDMKMFKNSILATIDRLPRSKTEWNLLCGALRVMHPKWVTN